MFRNKSFHYRPHKNKLNKHFKYQTFTKNFVMFILDGVLLVKILFAENLYGFKKKKSEVKWILA